MGTVVLFGFALTDQTQKSVTQRRKGIEKDTKKPFFCLKIIDSVLFAPCFTLCVLSERSERALRSWVLKLLFLIFSEISEALW